ncbi:hypothetical protein BGZ50_002097 [Haplosporangium sp. Z 11]|nr:hypothetical protein BGZ50_002097 [Haplosporangium sp. Z 11]
MDRKECKPEMWRLIFFIALGWKSQNANDYGHDSDDCDFDEHPYEFDFEGDRYTAVKMEEFEDSIQDDALNMVVAVGGKFTYEYWDEHEITVKRVIAGEA